MSSPRSCMHCWSLVAPVLLTSRSSMVLFFIKALRICCRVRDPSFSLPLTFSFLSPVKDDTAATRWLNDSLCILTWLKARHSIGGASYELKVFKKWFRFSFESIFLEISIYLNNRQPLNRLSMKRLISGGLASTRHSLMFNSSRPEI